MSRSQPWTGSPLEPSSFCSLSVWAVGVSAQPRPIGFVEALSLPVIQDPQLSPDGRQVVFVMETADWKANRRLGHLYRINVDGQTGATDLR